MKTHFRINITFFILSLISLASVYVSPEDVWIVGFISFAIPPLLLINLFYCLYWLRKKEYKRILWSLSILIVGWSQINRTISLDFGDESPNKTLGVLSGNVRVFNVYKHLRTSDPESSKKLINWLKGNENDILCLQEYYNEPGHGVYNTSKKLKESFPYQFIQPVVVNRIGAQFGVAIFSKHKILNTGTIPFKDKSKNQAAFADVAWNNQTIRIYNVHLESMHIPANTLFDGKNGKDELKAKGKDTFRRLKQGFITRAKQIAVVTKHIEQCPYPLIVCGDLNDLPYSYSYQQLRSILYNSFEHKGFGIGTTYNGKLPFLRIDNQFFSDKLKINQFEVHSDVDYSDHFPISAEYELAK